MRHVALDQSFDHQVMVAEEDEGYLRKASHLVMVKTNKPVESVPYLVSVIPQERVEFLVEKCRETLLRVPGNVLEVGVYKGGTLARLAEVVKQVCPQFTVFGIDTFTGHPYSDGHPVHPKGKYADVSIEVLKQAIAGTGLSPWISLFQGRVEHVLEQLTIKDISFAHIDCDLYIPVRYSALHVPSRLKAGGVMYFDDYGHEHCPGATKAVKELFEPHQVKEVLMRHNNTLWSCFISY